MRLGEPVNESEALAELRASIKALALRYGTIKISAAELEQAKTALVRVDGDVNGVTFTWLASQGAPDVPRYDAEVPEHYRTVGETQTARGEEEGGTR